MPTNPNRPAARRAKPTPKPAQPTQREVDLLGMAERLAEQNNAFQRERAAAAAEKRRHADAMAGAPKRNDPASLDARLAHIAKRIGEPTFAPEEGKFGGFSPSERRRIEDARRRTSLHSGKVEGELRWPIEAAH